MTVDDLINDVLKREGGFSNRAADRGGPTKYGITQGALSRWLGRPASIDEVRQLDEATAREIYERDYYIAPRLDTLPEPVRPVVFDWAVNHGPRGAIATLQHVLNLAGFGPVDEDGTLGPKTRNAATRAQSEMGPLFGNAIVDERENFYTARAAADPSQAIFLKGWQARAEDFRQEVV